MAGAKNHDYHILPPSITPLLGSFSALTMFFGLVMWMHPEQFGYGSLIFGVGMIGVIYTFMLGGAMSSMRRRQATIRL